MKTIRSKLWSVVSGNQIVSGGGGGRYQNQSIPDFVRGYNKHQLLICCLIPFTEFRTVVMELVT
jgi:hypothetical protein